MILTMGFFILAMYESVEYSFWKNSELLHQVAGSSSCLTSAVKSNAVSTELADGEDVRTDDISTGTETLSVPFEEDDIRQR